METPSELVKWFFLFLQTESAMLMRIEFLVVVIALLYLLMFMLDLWRLRSRSSAIKHILLVLDAIADSTFLYTMGLMQSAPFKKDLFPVWALVLVNLRFSGCFISAYGIPDQENRRMSELSTVMALATVAVLSSTRRSQFKHPIWAMWALQVVRSFYLIWAYLGAIRSTLHGKNSAFLTVASNHADEAPTRASNHADEAPPRASSPADVAPLWASSHAGDNPPRASNPGDEVEVDLDTMAGYDYPVCGDQMQKFEVKAPKYNFNVSTNNLTMLTTIETVWKRDGTLDKLSSRAGVDAKLMRDMCLSFSLYRLLRCRFDNFSLPDERVRKTRVLMTEIMRKWGPERTFRIVESELAFINDYFYTRYPVLFFQGFPLLGTLHPVATIAFTFWLGLDIHRSYKPRPHETVHVIHGVNVDLIITWVFMGVVVLKEVWKMVTYLLSDWTKVIVLCKCIAENSAWLLKWLLGNLFWLICTPRLKLVQHWHGKIDQYEFIQSYAYNPWMKNLLFYLSLGLLPKKAKGVKLGKAIMLPKEVKASILNSILSMDLKEGFLKGYDIPSLNKVQVEIRSEIQWAFKLNTCTHTILVWHIATSMCEIELARHYNTSLTDSEVLRALKSAKSCCSSQPYIIKLQRLEGAIRANFSVANSLSRYCAYMITKLPDLLPDSSFVPELILQSTIEEASKILDGCDNLQSLYRRLMREGETKDNTADDHLADDAEEQSRCCNLPSASCFLSLIKGESFRCFCSRNEGDNGRDGNQITDSSDAVIDVGGDEDHNPRGDDADDTDDVVPRERIITMGARLGRLLIQTIGDEVSRWEFLSKVWADLLVHVAPSWNTDAHKKYLATGGEFITHVWAILSHCDIKSSKLWPEEIPGEDGGTEGRQPTATGGDRGAPQQQSVSPKARRSWTANQEASSSTRTAKYTELFMHVPSRKV